MLHIESKRWWEFTMGSMFLSDFTTFGDAIPNGELKRSARQAEMLYFDDSCKTHVKTLMRL
jgi:hypothetical protein